MKKILIPTLLTLIETPLITMVSCNPGPALESWEVTEQEMVDAIKMKGVNYAQAQTSNKTISHITSERENHEIDSQKKETGVTEIISSCAYSPEHACQFIINNSTDRDTNAIEIYSIKGENTFDQYERDLYSSPKWEPEYDLPLDKFPTPSNTLGSAYYDLYKTLHDDLGFSFLPDKINKCYTGFAEYADGDSLRYIQQVSFYFNEKKLVKVVTDSCIFSTETGYSLSTANGVLTYQNIEPDEMPEVNDVVLDYDATSGSIPALFNTEGFTVDTKNEFNFIINSSLCTTATWWNSNKSYLFFLDEERKRINDLDFEVVFYSINDIVFQPGDDGEYVPKHYYYLDDFGDLTLLGVTQQNFDLSSPILSWVDVRFHNHDGEKIYPYWTNLSVFL